MKAKILVSALVVLVAIGIASFIFIASTDSYYSQGSSNSGSVSEGTSAGIETVNNNSGSSSSSGGSSSSSGNTISAEVLAQHGTKNDCWVLYKGKVYDLTSWLPIHPGGSSRIEPYCGNDGFESAFEKRHGTSQVARFMRVATYEGDYA